MNKLLIHFRGYLVGRSYFKASRSLEFMLSEFGDSLRKDGVTPVYDHPLRVAALIRTYTVLEAQGEMESILTVAILHDILEDTVVSYDTLTKEYGEDVSNAVLSLSKKKNYLNGEYYKAISSNRMATVVKAADRIHNLSSMLGVFSDEKIENYILETEDFVLPMLRNAKRSFPEYESVYENMKLIIKTQLDFARAVAKESE